MKSILVLTTFYDPFVGGAEISVREITQRLKEDFNFIVLTARYKKTLPKQDNDNGVLIYRLGLGCYYDRLLFPFLSLIKSFFIEFDGVYAVMASYAGAGALFIKVSRGKNYILNLQSGTLDTGHYLNIIKFFYPFYKLIHKKAGRVSVISRSLERRAERLGVSPDEIIVVPNGIDLSAFRILNDVERKNQRVISVARLEKVKGVDYLIRAWPLVLSEYPEAELLIAGDGSEKSVLEKLAAKLGADNSVKFLSWVNREKLPPLLNSGAVFVCPSLAEGLGVACIEAMACGLPVIGARVGGVPDVVKDGFNGFLVEPTNAKAIADKIIILLSDSEMREKLAANARQSVRRFDWQMITLEVKKMLRTL